MVWYGMVNVDFHSAIITKVSNAPASIELSGAFMAHEILHEVNTKQHKMGETVVELSADNCKLHNT